MRQIKTLIFFAAFALLAACASSEEQEAFKKIEAYYGCDVEWSKGFNSSAGKKTVKTINMTLKGGKMLGQLPKEIVAPYAAALLFENTPEDDMSKYTHVKVSVYDNPEDTSSYYEGNFPVEVIGKAADQKSLAVKAGLNLIAKTPDGLYDMLKPEFNTPAQKENFVNYFNNLLEERGSVTGANIVGVDAKVDNQTNDRLLQYTTLVKWGNKEDATIMTTTVYEEPGKNEVFAFNVQ